MTIDTKWVPKALFKHQRAVEAVIWIGMAIDAVIRLKNFELAVPCLAAGNLALALWAYDIRR